LPIEFCRVSRDRRLTLVIDEALGTPCETYAALSNLPLLRGAIENLRVREGKPRRENIGYVDIPNGIKSGIAVQRHPNVVGAIEHWTSTNGYDATIWTGLPSNFHEPGKGSAGGGAFSIVAAIVYLERLNPEQLADALAYIRSAPSTVQTPVRTAVTKRWPQNQPDQTLPSTVAAGKPRDG
jgi:hypothetical protein